MNKISQDYVQKGQTESSQDTGFIHRSNGNSFISSLSKTSNDDRTGKKKDKIDKITDKVTARLKRATTK